MIVSLSGDSLQGKPKPMPRLQILSPVEIADQIHYGGPTWLDRTLFGPERSRVSPAGFGAELNRALADRGRWLTQRMLVDTRADGSFRPKPEMATLLRRRETDRLAQTLARQLDAVHVPYQLGDRVPGVYDRIINTPTGKLAVIRNQDSFTLAPWQPAIEAMRGHAVTGIIQKHRITWSLDRGRGMHGPS